jgi:uncharacterized Tic20 family protein
MSIGQIAKEIIDFQISIFAASVHNATVATILFDCMVGYLLIVALPRRKELSVFITVALIIVFVILELLRGANNV